MADLRVEVRDLSEGERADWLERLARDWRSAELSGADAALCAYAEQLTQRPASMTAAHLERLRAEGLEDAEIHHAIQVVAYFNYINRVADAVHVDLEPEMAPYPGSGRDTDPGTRAAREL